MKRTGAVESTHPVEKGLGNAFMPLPNSHTKRLGRQSASETLRIVKKNLIYKGSLLDSRSLEKFKPCFFVVVFFVVSAISQSLSGDFKIDLIVIPQYKME